jgi:hypothetical protein
MIERPISVLLVPFSGGSTNNLPMQALHMGSAFEAAGMRVDEQKPERLRQPDPNYCCDIVLQIGLGKNKEGLIPLVRLRNFHPGVPIFVISHWKAKDIAAEVRKEANATFLQYTDYGGITRLIETLKKAALEYRAASSK